MAAAGTLAKSLGGGSRDLDEVTWWRLSWLSERIVGRRRVRGLGGGAGVGGHVDNSEVRTRPRRRSSYLAQNLGDMAVDCVVCRGSGGTLQCLCAARMVPVTLLGW